MLMWEGVVMYGCSKQPSSFRKSSLPHVRLVLLLGVVDVKSTAMCLHSPIAPPPKKRLGV